MESLDSRMRQASQRLDSTEAEIADVDRHVGGEVPYPGEESIDARDYDRTREASGNSRRACREIGDVDLGFLSEDAIPHGEAGLPGGAAP
jgi:hypothetical protein